MVPIAVANGLNDLPDPAAERQKRDRAMALAYVQKGESKTAVAEIVETTGIYIRTVYRGIKRELDWARSEHQKQKAPAATTD